MTVQDRLSLATGLSNCKCTIWSVADP